MSIVNIFKTKLHCNRCDKQTSTEQPVESGHAYRPELPEGWIEVKDLPANETQHFCDECVDAYKQFLNEGKK